MQRYHLFHLYLDGIGNPTRIGYASSREAQACIEAGLGRVQKAIDLGCYRLAATVRAVSLLDLYQKTAEAGPDWARGPDVQRGDVFQRTTSFGDIAIDANEGLAHSMYRGGWKEHPIENCVPLFLSSRRFEVAEVIEVTELPEPRLENETQAETEQLYDLCAM